ncbi:MAG: iron-binding protein [Pseudonocardiales bacterium]|nr:MAG: iron-binding protein [Pseudonocardiales bacterium]
MTTEPVRRRVALTDDGPVLVHGPIEVVLTDGQKVISDRAVTALCTCLRSRRYPICDTSHRRRVRNSTAPGNDSGMDPEGRGC